MKFLATATLLLASFGTATAEGLDTGKPVRAKEVVINKESGSRCEKDVRDLVELYDCPDPERRLQRSLEIKHRGLEGLTMVKGPAKDASYTAGNSIEIEVAGVTEESQATLVFTHADGETERIPREGNEKFVSFVNGNLHVEFKPRDLERLTGDWKFQMEYKKSDGTDGVFPESPATVTFKYADSGASVVRTSSSNGEPGPEDADEGPYEGEGQVLRAAGRIYFSSYGVDYSCSGTAIKDNKSGRSIILTAAHCVWDDIDEVWGSNAIFIPERDSVDLSFLEGTNQTAEDIHRMCSEDVCGCWELSGGVVHDKWPDTPWPDRLAYDYGFYIVKDSGSHVEGNGECGGIEALDLAVDAMTFGVGDDLENEPLNAFGYSLDKNPDFRYCGDYTSFDQPTAGVDTYFLNSCGLTGGASGGPWIKNFDPATGSGTVVTVNSWSYSGIAGMGAPIIEDSEARCLVNAARDMDIDDVMAQAEGEQGVFVNCYDRPCIENDENTERRLKGSRVLCQEKN